MTERIGLIGCVKKKLDHAAPARDLYTSQLFRGRRAYVERSCARWFILSAKHGLVDPAEEGPAARAVGRWWACWIQEIVYR